MKAWTIAKKDFRSYFASPIAYVLMCIFAFIMAWMFASILGAYLQNTARYQSMPGMKAPNVSDFVIRPFFGNMNVVFLMMIPAITMRLFAEEKKNNTIELLFTAPVTWLDIIAGKFFSAMGFIFVLSLLVSPLILALATMVKLDWGVLAMCYVGTILMLGVYVALGMWISSLTENQIIAFVLTFGLILFFWIIKWISLHSNAVVGDIFGYLSIVDHFEEFSRGVFNTKDLGYFISAIGMGWFFTYKTLESYSWRA